MRFQWLCSSNKKMHTFRVWAPKPQRVSVEVSGTSYEMASATGGWWTADVADAQPGSDYGFRLDGELVPDPRSPYQPYWHSRPLKVSRSFQLCLVGLAVAGEAAGKRDHL